MTFRPSRDRAAIRRLGEDDISRGGIIFADTARGQAGKGEIVAVGLSRGDEGGRPWPARPRPGKTARRRSQ